MSKWEKIEELCLINFYKILIAEAYEGEVRKSTATASFWSFAKAKKKNHSGWHVF